MEDRLIQLPFDVKIPAVESLNSGDINCLYENGNLRYLKYKGTEFIRMIYAAVRGVDWETAPYQIQDEVIQKHEKSFFITYQAVYELNNIHYKSLIAIEGREDNTIVFLMEGEALSTFKKNRIGLCLLHPIKECAGKEIIITQPNTEKYTAVFPVYISPHQPFKNVQKMEWAIANGFNCEIIFEGEVFETEDQRNWADNSYKTYSTPADLPFPVLVKEGDKMVQSIQLKIAGKKNKVLKQVSPAVKFHEEKFTFPAIGYSRVTGSKLLSTLEINYLKKIPFHHYRVELHIATSQWEEELNVAILEAEELDTFLELIIFFSNSFKEELKFLISKLIKHRQRIQSILPLYIEHKTTPVFLIEHVYELIKNIFPEINVGYGTNGNFVELNRNQPAEFEYDFVSFSMHPQAHATDTRTIIENLQSQQQLIESIKKFTAKPIHISPVTFQERSDPHKSTIYSADDTRLHTSFGASWTLHCIRNLCQVNHLTLYQATGKRGVINNVDLSNIRLSPVYHLLAELKSFDPAYLIQITQESNHDKIVFENKSGDKLTYWLDNLFAEPFNAIR